MLSQGSLRRICVWFALGIMGTLTVSAVNASMLGTMYWGNNFEGTIERANLDGSNRVTLVRGQQVPFAVRASLSLGKIYWSEQATSSHGQRIRRANLDGTQVETVASASSNVGGLTIDEQAGMLYWSESNNGYCGAICRIGLNGGSVQTVVSFGTQPAAKGIAIDKNTNKLYWAESYGDRILRSDLNGRNIEVVRDSGLSWPSGLAVDSSAHEIYLTNGSWSGMNGSVSKLDLDGTNLKTLVSLGQQCPMDIALDLGKGKMYWTDPNSNRIQRANLDGTGVETLLSKIEFPGSISIIPLPEPASLAMIALAGILIRRPRLSGRKVR